MEKKTLRRKGLNAQSCSLWLDQRFVPPIGLGRANWKSRQQSTNEQVVQAVWMRKKRNFFANRNLLVFLLSSFAYRLNAYIFSCRFSPVFGREMHDGDVIAEAFKRLVYLIDDACISFDKKSSFEKKWITEKVRERWWRGGMTLFLVETGRRHERRSGREESWRANQVDAAESYNHLIMISRRQICNSRLASLLVPRTTCFDRWLASIFTPVSSFC